MIKIYIAIRKIKSSNVKKPSVKKLHVEEIMAPPRNPGWYMNPLLNSIRNNGGTSRAEEDGRIVEIPSLEQVTKMIPKIEDELAKYRIFSAPVDGIERLKRARGPDFLASHHYSPANSDQDTGRKNGARDWQSLGQKLTPRDLQDKSKY